jgi:phage internal scaffolding protein
MRYHGTNSDGEPLSSSYVEKDGANPSFNLDCSNLPSATRQEFAEESDINNLMARYEATGLLPTNLNTNTPRYLDVSDVPDMRTALDSLANATAAFMALPASVRREFDNDAVKFVDFVQDPENRPQLKTWGLLEPEPPVAAPLKVEVTNPPPPKSDAP